MPLSNKADVLHRRETVTPHPDFDESFQIKSYKFHNVRTSRNSLGKCRVCNDAAFVENSPRPLASSAPIGHTLWGSHIPAEDLLAFTVRSGFGPWRAWAINLLTSVSHAGELTHNPLGASVLIKGLFTIVPPMESLQEVLMKFCKRL